jgi:23S rRNA (uridine2552-2'-O)-methyltransferase
MPAMAKRVLHDEFFLKAKAEGYLARSAYKLKELQERFRLIKRSDRVLDLGCAPGAWLQVAGELVGPKGRVAGIDLTPTDFAFVPHVTPLVGDLYKTEASVLLTAAGLHAARGERFDAVLSDMAPNTTGHGDHFLSVRLCHRMLELLPALLRPGGNACYKVFEGEEYPRLLRETAAMFASAKGFKPKSSRDVSVEMYVAAMGYRG